MTLSGRVLVRPVAFPCGWSFAGATDRGLILTSYGTANLEQVGTLGAWNPRTHRMAAIYARLLNLGSVQVSGNFVLWSTCGVGGFDGCRERVTNAITDRTRLLAALPHGFAPTGSANGYATSRNGDFTAIVAISATKESQFSGFFPFAPPDRLNSSPVATSLFVYNLRTASLVETRSFVAATQTPFEWSADGGYVLLAADLAHIEAVPLWSDSAPIDQIAVSASVYRNLDTDLEPAESFLASAAPASS